MNKASLDFTGTRILPPVETCVPIGKHEIITHDGITSTAFEACKRVGLKYSTYANRVRRGKSLGVALNATNLDQKRREEAKYSVKDIVTFEGESMTIVKACKLVGITYPAYLGRRKSGRTINEALTTGRFLP